MPRIFRQRLAHRIHDMCERIQPDDISGAKRRAAWAPNQGASERVDHLESNVQPLGVINRGEQ